MHRHIILFAIRHIVLHAAPRRVSVDVRFQMASDPSFSVLTPLAVSPNSNA